MSTFTIRADIFSSRIIMTFVIMNHYLNIRYQYIGHSVILCTRSGKDKIVKILLAIVIINNVYQNEDLVSSTNTTDSHDISGQFSE